MVGTNAGTGYPLTLRCAKCKRYRDYDNPQHADRGCQLAATGRIRPLTSQQFGHNSSGRALHYRAEYRCLDCGHIGWSRHVQMEYYLRGAGYQVPKRRGYRSRLIAGIDHLVKKKKATS